MVTMVSDDELCEDEEEMLVYVEFEGSLNNNTFKDEHLQLDIIGIDTEHPLMQINGRFYEGTYEDAVGTYMFFEKDDNPQVDDPVFDRIPSWKYVTKTRKTLKMQRVFIKERSEVLGDSENPCCIPNTEVLKEAGVPPKYQEEALSFWKKLRDNRMDALCAYLEKQRIREEKKSQGIVLDSESDEDNPFAVYKQTEAEETEKSEDENNSAHFQDANALSDAVQMFTEEASDKIAGCTKKPTETTDPRPSTSKEQFHSSHPKAMHKATVKVIHRKKGKICKNVVKRKQKKKQTPVQTEKVPETSKECYRKEEEPKIQDSEDKEDTSTTKEASEIIVVDTAIIQDTSVTETNQMKDLKMGDKKLQRQSRQEEKTKEISERLKAVAQEYLKTKSNV